MVQEDRRANSAKGDLSKLLNPVDTQTKAGESDSKSTAVEKSHGTPSKQTELLPTIQIHTHTHTHIYVLIWNSWPKVLCSCAQVQNMSCSKLKELSTVDAGPSWVYGSEWKLNCGYLGPARNAEFLKIRPQASLWIWPWECTNSHFHHRLENKKPAVLCLKTK